jgi:phytoene synthase
MTAPTYELAIKDVRERVAASRSSFTAGMTLLPRARREAMYALYAFCREVDDIADDGATLESRREELQQWRLRIRALFRRDEASDTITQALVPAIHKFALAEEDFQAIIDGMAMDAGVPICAPTLAMLDLYCDRVASAVGRASMRIFGDVSTNGMNVAHHLGRALQLTNILRDLAEDAARGRLYLPEEYLSKHSVTTRSPDSVLREPELRYVCRDLATIAREHFTQADAAMRRCKSSRIRPARLMRAYYGAIFDKLVEEDWYNPFVRVTLSRWQKVWLVLRYIW